MSRRPTLRPRQVRRLLRPQQAATGNRRTRVLRHKIRDRGRGRMISGTRFRWSIMIMAPPSLNNSLNHSRPIASLLKKSNLFTRSRHQRRGRTGRGGFPNRGTTRRPRSLVTRLPLLRPLPPQATSRKSKLYRPPRRTILHALGPHPEGIPPLQILLPLILRSKSLHHSHPRPLIQRQTG